MTKALVQYATQNTVLNYLLVGHRQLMSQKNQSGIFSAFWLIIHNLISNNFFIFVKLMCI